MNEPHVVDNRDDLPLALHHRLDDTPLTIWAFRVYAHLVRRTGRKGKAWPSYKSIGEHCFRATLQTASAATLRRRAIEAINELKAAGLIAVEQRTREDGGDTSNVYRLTPYRSWKIARG